MPPTNKNFGVRSNAQMAIKISCTLFTYEVWLAYNKASVYSDANLKWVQP
jgi:hypothetical protein